MISPEECWRTGMCRNTTEAIDKQHFNCLFRLDYILTLHTTVSVGNMEIFNKLMERPEYTRDDKILAIKYAIPRNQTEVIDKLLNITLPTKNEVMGLIEMAVMSENIEMVKFIQSRYPKFLPIDETKDLKIVVQKFDNIPAMMLDQYFSRVYLWGRVLMNKKRDDIIVLRLFND